MTASVHGSWVAATTDREPVPVDARGRKHSQSYGTVRLKIIGNEIIKNVGEYQSCMVSKLPIIFKRTRKYRSVRTVNVLGTMVEMCELLVH